MKTEMVSYCFIFMCVKNYGGLIFYMKEVITWTNFIIMALKAWSGVLEKKYIILQVDLAKKEIRKEYYKTPEGRIKKATTIGTILGGPLVGIVAGSITARKIEKK